VSDRLLDVSHVRDLLNIGSNARIYDLARRGILPGVVRIGRQVRFNGAEIQAFVARGGCSLADMAVHQNVTAIGDSGATSVPDKIAAEQILNQKTAPKGDT
jgi:predicted DNA-binding transcriptional regulator AlpA